MSEQSQEDGALCFNVGPTITVGPAKWCAAGVYGNIDWDNAGECQDVLMDDEVFAAGMSFLEIFNLKAKELGLEVLERHGLDQNKLKKKRERLKKMQERRKARTSNQSGR